MTVPRPVRQRASYPNGAATDKPAATRRRELSSPVWPPAIRTGRLRRRRTLHRMGSCMRRARRPGSAPTSGSIDGPRGPSFSVPGRRFDGPPLAVSMMMPPWTTTSSSTRATALAWTDSAITSSIDRIPRPLTSGAHRVDGQTSICGSIVRAAGAGQVSSRHGTAGPAGSQILPSSFDPPPPGRSGSSPSTPRCWRG